MHLGLFAFSVAVRINGFLEEDQLAESSEDIGSVRDDTVKLSSYATYGRHFEDTLVVAVPG